MKKFFLLFFLIPQLVWGADFSFGKDAGTFEFDLLHPTNALCTRVRTTINANYQTPSVRFDTVGLSGCKVVATGLLHASAASDYTGTLRIYFTTTAQTSKTVEFSVRGYAVVDWSDTNHSPERAVTIGTTGTTGSRNFIAGQTQYIDIDLTIEKATSDPCDSACNNRELVFYIQTTGNTSSEFNGALYVLDYNFHWSL